MAHIVVFDDDHLVHVLLESALKAVGHEVVSLQPASHFDALQVLHARVPDLLITDLEMPNCDGLCLVQYIREDPVLKHIRILVFTIHKETLLMEQLIDEFPDGIIFKPMNRTYFMAQVDALLPRPSGN